MLTLDYTIRDEESRIQYIYQLLKSYKNPSNDDLERMANYILLGKDANGQNFESRQAGRIPRSRNPIRRKADEEVSLEAAINAHLDPSIGEAQLHKIEKQTYTIKKRKISRTDPQIAAIPGMRDLWDSIDGLKEQLQDASLPPLKAYALSHWKIDLCRKQYDLLQSFLPTLPSAGIQFPEVQHLDFSQDSGYTREDGTFHLLRRQAIDYTNPKHIQGLIENYSDLYMELYDALDSWGRALLFDLDALVDATPLSPDRKYILYRRIDKIGMKQLCYEVERNFGKHYTEASMQRIVSIEIPTAIARTAQRQDQQAHTPHDIFSRKQCHECKRWLPRTPLFFSKHCGRSDGISSICKECTAQRRKGQLDGTYVGKHRKPKKPSAQAEKKEQTATTNTADNL